MLNFTTQDLPFNIDIAVYLPLGKGTIIAAIPVAYRPLRDWSPQMFFGGNIGPENGYFPIRTHGQVTQAYDIYYVVFYR